MLIPQRTGGCPPIFVLGSRAEVDPGREYFFPLGRFTHDLEPAPFATGSHVLYEIYNAHRQTDGSWKADSGARYDLHSNALRQQTWTSADAAGLPMLPGLVRYDEVASGAIIRSAVAFGADALGVFDLKRAMAQRNLTGAPGTKEVARQLARWRAKLR